jgi:hypothetical protein
MGIYTDLASTNPIPGKPRVGLDRSSGEQLLAKANFIDPTIGAAYAAANEVATIPEQTDAGVADTYTLTITPYGAYADQAPITTAAIAYNAVDTVIQTALDTAFAAWPSWTNADIAVAMVGAAGLDDGAISLTFSGTSVASAPFIVTLTPTGFTATGPIVRTTAGQGDRKAAQALTELNVIQGTLHNSGEAPTDWVRPAANGQSRPRFQLIRDLAIQASVEDGTDDVYDTVVALYPVS